MICPVCNAAIPERGRRCPACGAALGTTLAPGHVLAGRYEVGAVLGTGGMGTVYRARDLELDEVVALKILRAEVAHSPEAIQRFRSEIKLARRVTHRNVCRLYEYGVDGKQPYVAMELLEGADLRQLAREGSLTAEEAFDVVIQAANGLAAIHEVGVIHRDLKGANILREKQGRVVVTDFGIAKEVDTSSGLSVQGLVLGTPPYISPEQARGHPADFRSDLYSFGVVVFEAFTGDVPFRGENAVKTLEMHVRVPPPLEGERAARIPAPVVPVLRKALAKDPAQRFTSAAHLAEALHSARTQWIGASASAVTAVTPALPPRRAYVLVVGGTDQERSWLRAVIGQTGLEVFTATEADVQDTQDLLPPGLLVLDADGPRETRLALQQRLRAHPSLAAVPLLVLARESDIESFADAITRGAAAYLTKPLDAQELMSTARRLAGWIEDEAFREKRRYQRRPVLLHADVSVQGGTHDIPARILEVSSHGCQIELPQACVPADRIRVVLRGPQESTHLALGGEVRWSRPSPATAGMHLAGVEFRGKSAVYAASVLGIDTRRDTKPPAAG